MCSSLQVLFCKVFVGPNSILWCHWYSLFRTLDDSAYEFQSQDGSVVACALFSLPRRVKSLVGGTGVPGKTYPGENILAKAIRNNRRFIYVYI